MARYTGTALIVKFGATDLEALYRTFEWEEVIDTVDETAGADVVRTYLTTLKDGTAELTLLDGVIGTALWTALALGSSGTLEWGPEGSTIGNPKYSCVAWVTKRAKTSKFDDLTELSVSFQFSGAVTDEVYT